MKRKADRTIEKYKACKVGRGFTQEAGINYKETYFQMMRPETFKLLIIIALYHNWEIRQWDVVAAYLQAALKHDIYISDVNEDGETEYWLLHKAVYGLKQAGHEWYLKLVNILQKAGYEQCVGDEGCFQRKGKTAVGTHVDDILGIGRSKDLDTAELLIEQEVEVEKKGKPEKMLGMEAHWTDDQVVLTQTALIEATMQTHCQKRLRNRLKRSPMLDPCYYAKGDDAEERAEQKKFQALVGSLLFISRMTRPDIAIHVNLLGRRMSDPTMKNYQAALRVLSYLKATSTEGITLKRPKNLEIKILANAAYGGEKARSQSGAILTVGGQAIGWSTR